MEKFFSFQVENRILRGILHLPQGVLKKVPGIVMCHGFMGTKIGMHRIFVKAAREFAQRGYAVLRFDFSGCGDSEGKHEEITLDRQINEARGAVEALSTQPGIDKENLFLLGLSLGGCIAALTAVTLPDLAGVALWAPVARPFEDLQGILGDKFTQEVIQGGEGDFQGYAIGHPFLISLMAHDPLQAVKDFSGHLLILHGTGDEEIPYQNAFLYREKRRESGLLRRTRVGLILDADHTFSSVAWEKEVFSKTLRWLDSRSRISYLRRVEA